MIKRGNLVFAVMICGMLPLLGAIITSYWLVSGTTAKINARSQQAMKEQTQRQLAEVNLARKAIAENHLRQIEFGVSNFAKDANLIEAMHAASIQNEQIQTGAKPDGAAFLINEQVVSQIENQQRQLGLSNVFLCEVLEGRPLYSFHGIARDIPQSKLQKLQTLQHQYVIRDADKLNAFGLPFQIDTDQGSDPTAFLASPIETDNGTVGLLVFEISLAKLNTLAGMQSEQLQSTLLVNDADTIAGEIAPGDISSIASVGMQNWNLSLVARTDQSQAMQPIRNATKQGASLAAIMCGGSQVATLWTVFIVIAGGTLMVNLVRQPVEVSSRELEQISLEGSGLLLDDSTNRDRNALLNWVATVVKRVDIMTTRLTGDQPEHMDMTFAALAKADASTITENGTEISSEFKEVIRRSQRSLASAVEAARLAENAISKLGTNISAEEVSSLQEVVSDINAQSQWMYENSSWIDETSDESEMANA